jgi:hypothetical protein
LETIRSRKKFAKKLNLQRENFENIEMFEKNTIEEDGVVVATSQLRYGGRKGERNPDGYLGKEDVALRC